MLNPNTVLSIARARELELDRAAERARIIHLETRRERRASRRASEPAPHSSREAKTASGPLASCELR